MSGHDDGTSPGVQCGAVHDIAGRCTRDVAHPGAHVARSSKPGHGFGGWRNTRPGEPDTTYVASGTPSDRWDAGTMGEISIRSPYRDEPGSRVGGASPATGEGLDVERLRAALRDFEALLPPDRWPLLKPETQATVDADYRAARLAATTLDPGADVARRIKPEWVAALLAHEEDFLAQPESFDTEEAVIANIVGHLHSGTQPATTLDPGEAE